MKGRQMDKVQEAALRALDAVGKGLLGVLKGANARDIDDIPIVKASREYSSNPWIQEAFIDGAEWHVKFMEEREQRNPK